MKNFLKKLTVVALSVLMVCPLFSAYGCDDGSGGADRAKVLKFYDDRRAQLATCEPNLAHYTISKLKKEFG